MENTNTRRRGRAIDVAAVIILLVLLAGQAAALIFLAEGSWVDRLKLALQLLGFYNIGLGLVSGSKLLRNFGDIDAQMSSPILLEYTRGNMLFLTLLASIWSVGLEPRKLQDASAARGCLGNVVMLISSPLLFLYILFHVLVIMPMAYLGFVFSSSIVENIIHSARDVKLTMASEGDEDSRSMKELIKAEVVKAKTFLVGIPAIGLSMILAVLSLFGNT